jgi:hypothetical protein
MSKHTRALVLAAMVAAMNLAGLTAMAQAQPPDAVEQFHRGERTTQENRTPTDAVERFRQSERASQQQPTTAEAVEEFRRAERAFQKQPTTADPTQQELAERWNDWHYQATRMSRAQDKAWTPSWQRADNPTSPPAQVPAPVQPAGPNGQPGWLVVSLGVLAAVLALVAGLAMLAARRANHRTRVGQAA